MALFLICHMQASAKEPSFSLSRPWTSDWMDRTLLYTQKTAISKDNLANETVIQIKRQVKHSPYSTSNRILLFENTRDFADGINFVKFDSTLLAHKLELDASHKSSVITIFATFFFCKDSCSYLN